MRHPRAWHLLTALALLPASTPAGAEELPRVFLLDIQPQGVPEDLARSLTGLLGLEMERGRLFEVVSEGDVRLMLQVEERRLLLGDEGFEGRMAEIGKRAQTPYALAAVLGRVGAVYLLSLRLLDVERAQVVRRVEQTLSGDEEALLGSLRAAVLALTLEEKGVSPDISQALIDDLRIAEKPKAAFLSFSFGYEVPIGSQTSSMTGGKGIQVFRPSYYHFRLQAEVPVWRLLQVFAALSVGSTLADQTFNSQDKHAWRPIDVNGEQIGDGSYQGAVFRDDFSALRVPFTLGLKLAPARGRFLPYALLGIGFSWQRLNARDAAFELLQEHRAPCPEPFEELPAGAPSYCGSRAELAPSGAVEAFGLEVTGGAGLDWLFHENLGLKIDVRYGLTYAFRDEGELQVSFRGRSSNAYTDGHYDEYGEVYAVQRLHQGLIFSLGLIGYF